MSQEIVLTSERFLAPPVEAPRIPALREVRLPSVALPRPRGALVYLAASLSFASPRELVLSVRARWSRDEGHRYEAVVLRALEPVQGLASPSFANLYLAPSEALAWPLAGGLIRRVRGDLRTIRIDFLAARVEVLEAVEPRATPVRPAPRPA